METKASAQATAEELSQRITDEIAKTTKELTEHQAKAFTAFETKHLKVPGLIGKGPLDKYADVPAYLRAVQEQRAVDLDKNQKALAAAVAELEASIKEEAANTFERGSYQVERLSGQLEAKLAELKEASGRTAEGLATEAEERMQEV